MSVLTLHNNVLPPSCMATVPDCYLELEAVSFNECQNTVAV